MTKNLDQNLKKNLFKYIKLDWNLSKSSLLSCFCYKLYVVTLDHHISTLLQSCNNDND